MEPCDLVTEAEVLADLGRRLRNWRSSYLLTHLTSCSGQSDAERASVAVSSYYYKKIHVLLLSEPTEVISAVDLARQISDVLKSVIPVLPFLPSNFSALLSLFFPSSLHLSKTFFC